MAVTLEDVRRAACALLPVGDAWRGFHDPESTAGGVIQGLSEEWQRIDARADRLVDESDPRTAQELFSQWCEVWGVPDECTLALVPDMAREQLRELLAWKVGSVGLYSKEFYRRVAAMFGYEIEIEEPRPKTFLKPFNYPFYSDAWRANWFVVVIKGPSRYHAKTFLDPIGSAFATWGNSAFECVIRAVMPAHTLVTFSYQDEDAQNETSLPLRSL